MSWNVVNRRPLRSGGNGDLFIGQRSDDGETVVAKYLREYQSAQARKAFAREVRILARGLPRVMPILGWNMEAEPPFYVMPYFTGGSLTKYAGRLSDGQMQLVATEIALALAALHEVHVADGDVKPDNVLLSQDGRLNVSDPLGNGLGCTVLFSQNHGGTPGYWAPEVRAGGPISRAGDVFSYGATLTICKPGANPATDSGSTPVRGS